MGTILALIASPLGRKVTAVVVCLALFGGVVFAAYHRGQASGYSSGQRSQLEIDKQSFDNYKAAAEKSLQDLSAKITSSEKLAQDAQDRATASQGKADSLQKGIEAVVRAIPSGSKQPPAEDTAKLADYPGLFQENELRKQKEAELQNSITELHASNDSLKKANEQLKAQVDVAVALAQEANKNYVVAYNAAQVHHSTFVKVITFGLVHDRHLNIPPPIELKPHV